MADCDPVTAILARLSIASSVRDVVQACQRALPDAGGVAVAVMTSTDARRVLYASDKVGAEMEEAQFLHGEGPCFDAFTTTTVVNVADLHDPANLRRWPGYTPAALTAGASTVAALPITAGGPCLGVLDLYRTIAEPFSPRDIAVALRFAAAAGAAMLTAAGINTDTDGYPPEDRDVVFQAVGMIMVQAGLSSHDALARLRAHTFAAERTLTTTATQVLAHQLSFTLD
jgi:transcriptional regulator with GAF, ATPase, and Fis domain